MKIPNPFKLQNWEYKKFLIVILGIQFSLLGIFGINNLGIETPLLRGIIGFISFSFVPGYLILRILNLNKLNSVESITYALGSSLVYNMILGTLLNVLLPLFNITSKPLSETSVLISGFILSVFFISGIKNKFAVVEEYVNIKNIDFKILFLTLLCTVTILGTILVNTFENTLLLKTSLILIIGTIFWMIFFEKNYKLYPFSIWIISISLLIHILLISNYLVITDNVAEYVIAKLVLNNSYWFINSDVFIWNTYNSVPSVTILPTVLHQYTGVSLLGIYKFILPIYYSFVPVLIYSISLTLLKEDRKMSFVASILFMSFVDFIRTALIPKQSLAILFVLLTIDAFFKKNKTYNKVYLPLLFGIGIILSHYGTAYLILVMMIFSLILSKLFIHVKKIRTFKLYMQYKYYVLLLLISTFCWYIYVAQSSTFNVLFISLHNIILAFSSEFLDIMQSRGLYILSKELPSYSSLITKIIMIITTILASFGVLFCLIKNVNKKFKSLEYNTVYLFYGIYWVIILLMSAIVPKFAIMDPKRLLQLSMMILSPYVLFGAQKLYNLLFNRNNKNMGVIIVGVLSIILMSTSCIKIIPDILNDGPTSIAISKEKILNSNNNFSKISYFMSITLDQDYYVGKWTKKYYNGNKIYRGDWSEFYPPLIVYNGISEYDVNNILSINVKGSEFEKNRIEMPKNSYFQFSYPNIKYNLYWTWYNELQQAIPYSENETLDIKNNYSKIYCNNQNSMYYDT
jgi:uncharacterized membrane protein